ncbi:MAG: DUF4293 domain-containing protein [Saprospiraceae bacterium]|nr:DUF4293 domain-containing protein [Saprospiraceae bacterium]
MIQRIQTVFLLLAVATLGLQFLFPYASAPSTAVTDEAGTFSDGVFNLHDRLNFLVNTIAALILALAAVFLFKNRPLQSKITSIGIFVATILAISLAVQSYMLIQDAGPAMTNIHYQPGIAMPALSVLLLWIANRFIRKDEALVRSSDRLR